MQYISHYHSPLGEMTMACNGTALTGLWFDGQKYYGSTLDEYESREFPIFDETRRWLDAYFSGEQPGPLPELCFYGSPFRRMVWRLLCAIPYGKVVTYKEIAQKIACMVGRVAMSAQAVGGAVGHNPISIIVPCHRVLACNGHLNGYAGGLSRKSALLALECADMANPTVIV